MKKLTWFVFALVISVMLTPAVCLAQNDNEPEILKALYDINIQKANELILQGADVNASGQFGNTPLTVAAQNGHTDTVKLLIDHGANVNAQNGLGETALLLAAANGHTDIAKLLIAAGADANIKNDNGVTPLGWAEFFGYTDIVEMLRAAGAN